MSLGPFRRHGRFYDTQSELNRLLDETFGGSGQLQRGRMVQHEWVPSVDVVRKDGDLIVRAELPGVKPEDVDITVHEGVLTISGEREAEQEEERAEYYVREVRHGSFRRSMALPEDVDEEKVRARYQDGILEVTLEGAVAAREPRRIQIEVAGGQHGTSDVNVTTPTTRQTEREQEDKSLIDKVKETLTSRDESDRQRGQ
ncbi:MAG TPA: Hsp20/alpha crystallin family protein [Rubrobacteraceae bacterium]|nr:Hsp20/alpha crystallin family protein [Rubrobacteraceae bacterium]